MSEPIAFTKTLQVPCSNKSVISHSLQESLTETGR